MKTFYTELELSKLSREELIALTQFVKDGKSVFYSEIKKMNKNKEDYEIVFKDGTSLWTKDSETYSEILTGKSRFDLVSSSINKSDTRNEIFEDFVNKVFNRVQESQSELKDIVKNIADDTKKTQKSFRDSIESISNDSEITATKWNNKIAELHVFDTKTFDIKMKKIDKIIDAFESLLRD